MMFNHNWLLWPVALLAWLLICDHNLGINGQSQNAIGAHREYQKTSFSCTGRPAGYYADVETGCQVYHMCDGLGRQFSYSCPNTTLFQQRMLICDHWYMVNCSKAESDYAANLLIGQRDKPFVNDEENSLRTPRPDLLDRPYAPDYSGESFRNQYKTLPAAQNRIEDTNTQKQHDKTIQHAAPAGQQRWKIPPPSRLILPPAYEPQIEVEPRSQNTPNTSNSVKVNSTPSKQSAVIKQSFSSSPSTETTKFHTTTRKTTTTTTTTTTTRRPYVAPKAASNIKSHFNGFDSAALHQRQDEHDDLGTSHSTRYNTSADFNSAELPSSKVYKTYDSSKTTSKQPIKVPSKFYEPPFVYPIYNENDTLALSTETPLRVSSASPFVAPTTKYSTTPTTTTRTTTTRPFTRPTTLAGKPFSTAFATPTVVAVPASSTKRTQKQQNSDRFNVQKITHSDARTPTPAQGFKPPTPRPPTTTMRPSTPTSSRLHLPTPFINAAQVATSNSIVPEIPANDLLPPFQEFILHDTATTVGPPIYYEWKVPSNGLEPPKLDPPIGVDGREYPDTVIDYNAISATNSFVPSQNFGVDQQRSNSFQPVRPSSTTRTPTIRSVQNEKVQRTNGIPSTEKKTDILQIRKELSVPEYSFPLESIGRTGYLSTDTYNSFQLKIPERRSDSVEEHFHWFGENPKCPECHPSYVVPGTCEPCLRR